MSIIERFVRAIEAIATAQARQAKATEYMAETLANSSEYSERMAVAQETWNILQAQKMVSP